jgi:hypothetical protein
MKQYESARRTAASASSGLSRLLPCTLLAASLSSGCATQIGSGDGKVIDYVSNEPIPAAAVTLTCSVPRMVHGSDKKILETVSAADGSYHFDPSGLRNCDYFSARAVKEGYGLDSMTDSLTKSGGLDSMSRIPKAVYLIKESDQPMVLLERLADYTPVEPFAAGPNASYYFYLLYKSFIASRRIAATPKMDAWVREHYCARLNASWRVLSDQQRFLREDGHSPIDGSPISLRPDSYEKDVRPYCGA